MTVLNELNDREASVLEYIIRDYVKTAEPVSSARASNQMRLGVSPATVRNIMAGLDDYGFFGAAAYIIRQDPDG